MTRRLRLGATVGHGVIAADCPTEIDRKKAKMCSPGTQWVNSVAQTDIDFPKVTSKSFA